MAATTIIASGDTFVVDATYEAVQQFWLQGSQQAAAAEFETVEGTRAMIAATAITAIREERRDASNRIGFV